MTTATATKKAPRSQSNAAAAKAATKIVPRPEAKPTPAERASRAAKRIADEILASSTPQQAFEDAAVAVLTGKSSRKPHASRPLAVQVEQGPETRTRVENLAVAKIENAALRSWKEAGAKGERPATPTIDWMSSTPGFFAAGDAQRGQSLIVWAISDGRECARAVDLWLMGHSELPTKSGADLPRV